MSNLAAIYTLGDVLAPVERALRLVSAEDLLLAVKRIDLHYRELCALSDWPALRAYTEITSDASDLYEIEGALGISAVSLDSDGAPFWFCERWDVPADDLRERRLWSSAIPQAPVTGDDPAEVWISLWAWDSATEVHVPSNAETVRVDFWRAPPSLITTAEGESDTYDETDPIYLPETRALVVRSVLDLIGLMDRSEQDAAPWRAEMEGSLARLFSHNPRAAGASLRLPSGRILTRSPAR